jgi:uncharacterized protein YciI
MIFLVHTYDRAGAIDIRLDQREAHLAWLKAAGDRVKAAGPWMDEDGQMAGSLLIVDREDGEAINAWLATDPYALAGLFERVEVAPFKWVLNPPAGLDA